MIDESAARRRFEAVFDQHSRSVLSYALRRTSSAADAADVLSETMLVAWRRIGDVPTGDQAKPWLFGVARRVLANQRRATFRRERLGERLRGEDGRGVGGALSDAASVDPDLHAALARLSMDDREVLRLAVWEALRSDEIAVVLGVSRNAVRVRLHRARQRLHDVLRPSTLIAGSDPLLKECR